MSDPGTAAPQCGISEDKSEEECRSGRRRTQGRTQESPRQEHRGWYSRGYLPHFDSPYAIQHITYRLVDSLPHTVLEKLQSEAATVQVDRKRKAELRQLIETYLDAGHGSCVLQEPEVAACILDTWPSSRQACSMPGAASPT